MAYNLPSDESSLWAFLQKLCMSSKCQVALNNVCSRCSFMNLSQLCLVWADFDWLRPLTLQLGMLKCPLGDCVTSEAPKLHPHIVLTPTIFFPWRGLQLSCALGIYRRTIISRFPCFWSPFSMVPMPQLYPINISSLLPGGRQIWRLGPFVLTWLTPE